MYDPTPVSVWRHTNGTTYFVVAIANKESKDPIKYPKTVVYRNMDTFTWYSRPLDDWHRSFEEIEV